MNPLVPLRISGRIRLLVLWLEDTHDFPVCVSSKIAPRAALGNHTWVHALIDSNPHALDDLIKLGLGHGGLGHGGEGLGGGGSNACGRVKDRVVYLQTLFLSGLLPPCSFELGCNLIGPSLQPCVDSFQINTRVAPSPSREVLLPREHFGRCHTGVRPRLRDGCEARDRLGLERGRALSQKLVIGLVAELVGLGKAFIARGGRSIPRHRWRAWRAEEDRAMARGRAILQINTERRLEVGAVW